MSEWEKVAIREATELLISRVPALPYAQFSMPTKSAQRSPVSRTISRRSCSNSRTASHVDWLCSSCATGNQCPSTGSSCQAACVRAGDRVGACGGRNPGGFNVCASSLPRSHRRYRPTVAPNPLRLGPPDWGFQELLTPPVDDSNVGPKTLQIALGVLRKGGLSRRSSARETVCHMPQMRSETLPGPVADKHFAP